MSDDATDKKIKINKVWITRGGPVDDHNLMGCYFEEVNEPDKYHFYGKQNSLIPTIPDVLTAETTDFKFIRDGVSWTVNPFHLDLGPVMKTANGHWSNSRGTDDDDGDFHATAGPGAGEEEESASSATA